MKKEKEDRRVKYTRMVLKDSFIGLLREKELSQITVKKICECADINRTTFYTHYADQYDLMQKIEQELLDNVDAYLSENEQDHSGSVVRTVETIFEYIKKNAELCRLLLSERGDILFQKRIMKLIYDKYMNTLLEGGKVTRDHAEFIYAFLVTGCIGVIQKWLNEDMEHSTRFMAERVVAMSAAVTDSALAVPTSRKSGSSLIGLHHGFH